MRRKARHVRIGAILMIVALLFVTAGCSGGKKPEDYTDDEILEVLNASSFGNFASRGSNDWYGENNDDQRVAMGEELIGLFTNLGYDIKLGAGDFAQAMNDHFDQDGSKSIWHVACIVAEVSPERYDELYNRQAAREAPEETAQALGVVDEPEEELEPPSGPSYDYTATAEDYGLQHTGGYAETFVEPLTGIAVDLPERFADSVMQAVDDGYGTSYIFVDSPDNAEDFSLFSSDISALLVVQYRKNAGVSTTDDILEHMCDPDFDKFATWQQNNMFVVVQEVAEGSSEPGTSYRTGILYNDGGYFYFALTVYGENSAEEAHETFEEIGLDLLEAPGMGHMRQAEMGPLAVGDPNDLGIGLRQMLGAWYAEESGASIVFQGDGSAFFARMDSEGDVEELDCYFVVEYANYTDGRPIVKLADSDMEYLRGFYSYSDEVLVDLDDHTSYYRTDVNSLPEDLQPYDYTESEAPALPQLESADYNEALKPFQGKWRNEDGEMQLDVEGDRYILTHILDMTIQAGVCGVNGLGELDMDLNMATLDGSFLTVAGIAGVFDKVTVYDGGADDDFIGEWENDTQNIKMTIDSESCQISTNSGGYYTTYAATDEGLQIGTDDEPQMVYRTADGGLQVDGYEGIFYRVGEGRGAPSPFEPFIGSWYNETAEWSFQIDDGIYVMGSETGMSAGGAEVDGNRISFSDYTGYMDDNGNIILDGVEGIFVKQ